MLFSVIGSIFSALFEVGKGNYDLIKEACVDWYEENKYRLNRFGDIVVHCALIVVHCAFIVVHCALIVCTVLS
jgi:hypothetical protein